MGATDLKAVEFLASLPNTQIKVSYNTANERFMQSLICSLEIQVFILDILVLQIFQKVH
jgi:hypothetical protein